MGEGPALHLERLTWQQICELYPDEWVVLADVCWAGLIRGLRVSNGLFVSHGSEEESWACAKHLLPTFGELVHVQTHATRDERSRPVACPCPDW